MLQLAHLPAVCQGVLITLSLKLIQDKVSGGEKESCGLQAS